MAGHGRMLDNGVVASRWQSHIVLVIVVLYQRVEFYFPVELVSLSEVGIIANCVVPFAVFLQFAYLSTFHTYYCIFLCVFVEFIFCFCILNLILEEK